MKQKSSIITVGQFAMIEEDQRRGFNTKWIVDKHGCPACGNITKYQLKQPTMPVVSTCNHVRGLDDSKSTSKKKIWVVNYTYDLDEARKLQKPPEPITDIRFHLTENGTKEKPITLRAQRGEALLFAESCTKDTFTALMRKIVGITDSWCRSNLDRPLEKCSIIAESKMEGITDTILTTLVLRAINSIDHKTNQDHKAGPASSVKRHKEKKEANPKLLIQSSLFKFFPQEVAQ